MTEVLVTVTTCKGVVKDNIVVLEDGAQLPDGAVERLGRPGQALGVSSHSRAAPRGGPAGAGDVYPDFSRA